MFCAAYRRNNFSHTYASVYGEHHAANFIYVKGVTHIHARGRHVHIRFMVLIGPHADMPVDV